MKSIERRYKRISKKENGLSSYQCFVEAVNNQYFRRRTIQCWFNKLVNKDDYCSGDKHQIINFLEHISNEPDGGTN
jgi:hypothetical protein